MKRPHTQCMKRLVALAMLVTFGAFGISAYAHAAQEPAPVAGWAWDETHAHNWDW